MTRNQYGYKVCKPYLVTPALNDPSEGRLRPGAAPQHAVAAAGEGDGRLLQVLYH